MHYFCRAEGPLREGPPTQCVSSPLHSFLILIALRILGAIITSDDVVTVFVTPPVLIDLMKAKIMFRLFLPQSNICHSLVSPVCSG